MVRWIRLSSDQYFGFWLLGLILFVLQEVPYILMPFFNPEPNPIMNMNETSVLLDTLEKITGSLCIALMIFVIHKDAVMFSVSGNTEKLFFLLTLGVLAANYCGWALYYTGHRSVFVMMAFIVAMPPLYYVATGLWRQNTPLTVAGAVFFLIHFVHVWGNLHS